MRAREIAFFVPGRPVTQGSKNVYRGRVVESAKGWKEWRVAVAWHARRALVGLGEPLTGGLVLSITFTFQRPKRPAHDYPMPDLDKLVRAIGDACKVARLIAEDSQIWKFRDVEKVFGVTPGASIALIEQAPP